MNRTVYILCASLILLSIAARFIQIDSTVIGWHSWRQSDTAALARNFHDSGEGIFYPQVDWGGGGYAETEFQLYTYAVSMLYSLFGVHEIFGRLLSIALSLVGILGLFLLVERFYSRRIAVLAATIYAIIPLSIFYSRAFMPEPAMLAAIIWGLYFFDRWQGNGTLFDGILSCILITSAVLLKIPVLYIGLPLLYIAWTHAGSIPNIAARPGLWIYAAVLLVATYLWYSHAYNLFLQTGNTFGIWIGSTNKWGDYGSLLSFKFYNDVFFKSIAERHLTWPGMLLFIYGLFIVRKNRRQWLAEWWLVAVIIYILVVNKGNQVHEYYQLPFIPPAVIVIARALDRILEYITLAKPAMKRFAIAGLSVIVLLIVLLSGFRYGSLLAGERSQGFIDFADRARQIIPAHEKVLDVGDGNPVTLYLLHRKGWIVNCQSLHTVKTLPNYIVLHKNEPGQYDCTAFESLIANSSEVLAIDDLVLLRRNTTSISGM